MPRQDDVIRAFALGEDGPRQASNMRYISDESNTRRFLLGGKDGISVVLAEIEPIDQVSRCQRYIFSGPPTDEDVYSRPMSRGHLYNQIATVRRVLREYYDTANINRAGEQSRTVSEHDNIEYREQSNGEIEAVPTP